MSDIGAQYDLNLASCRYGALARGWRGPPDPPDRSSRSDHAPPPRCRADPLGALALRRPHALWQTANCMHTPPHTFADHAACLAPHTEVRVIQPGHSTAIHAADNALLS